MPENLLKNTVHIVASKFVESIMKMDNIIKVDQMVLVQLKASKSGGLIGTCTFLASGDSKNLAKPLKQYSPNSLPGDLFLCTHYILLFNYLFVISICTAIPLAFLGIYNDLLYM